MRIVLVLVLVTVAVGFALHRRLGNDGGDTVPETPVVAAPAPKLPEYLLFDRPVATGEFVRREDLKWMRFDPEKADIPTYAVSRTDQLLADFEGALVMRAADKDDFVDRRAFLLPQESRFLASVLTPGKRAISIEIGAVTGNSYLVQPGDTVDLILFTDLNGDGRTEKSGFIARTILENMRVIAIDRKIAYHLASAEDGTGDGAEGDKARRKRGTATLEVTPRQAEIITVARQMGTLSLSLRSKFEQPNNEVRVSAAGEGVRSHDVIPEFFPSAPKKNLEIVELFGAEQRRKTGTPGDGFFDGDAQ